MENPIIDTKPFTVNLNGDVLQVTVHLIGHNIIYRIVFPDNRPELKLFRAKGIENPKFWTSIPENLARIKETEAVGQLIFDHYNPPVLLKK
ncbi:MAG: hypothetical protein V4539_01170 [Bacteroidota bacterium]